MNFKLFTSRFSLFILLLAAALEGLQYILPYRAFNLNDLLANSIGIGLGVAIAVVFVKFQRLKSFNFE